MQTILPGSPTTPATQERKKAEIINALKFEIEMRYKVYQSKLDAGGNYKNLVAGIDCMKEALRIIENLMPDDEQTTLKF